MKGELPSTQADSSGQELARPGEETLGKSARCQQRDLPSKADGERPDDVGCRDLTSRSEEVRLRENSQTGKFLVERDDDGSDGGTGDDVEVVL